MEVSKPTPAMTFVTTPTGGVHLVPGSWLDALMPSGFRRATPEEIAFWYEERGLDAPEIELPSEPATSSARIELGTLAPLSTGL